MADLTGDARIFWDACARGTVDKAAGLREQQQLVDSVAARANDVIGALTQEIGRAKLSTSADLKAHIDAIALRHGAVVEIVDVLRRTVGSARLLPPRFADELGASIGALRAKLASSCTGYLAALSELLREWQRFSGEAAGVTNEKVAAVRQELAQLDARKASTAGAAGAEGERLIRECEDEYRQAVATIDASLTPSLASRPLQYWTLLVGSATAGGVTAAFFGAAPFGRVVAALLAGGTVWCVLRWVDHAAKKAEPGSRALSKTQAESARNEGIRRISREQEQRVRSELERIAVEARRLQRDLDEALGALSEGRERSQRAARDMFDQERRKVEQSWKPLEAIATEVIQVFQAHHAKATDVAREALREQIRLGMQKSQADIDAEVARLMNASPLKCIVGVQRVGAPSGLQPFMRSNESITVPHVVDLIDSCYITHDASAESLATARRLASWHAMEIRQRLGAVHVTVADLASLGSGYGELLSMANDQEVSLLAAARDLSEKLAELMRAAAVRNRLLAASGEPDWSARRARTAETVEPAVLLVLEVPRGGLPAEQGAQVETLLGVGRSAGVVLIVLVAGDLPQAKAPATRTARRVDIVGSAASESGVALAVPGRDERARIAKSILDCEATAKPAAEPVDGLALSPSSSFAEFMDTVVPMPLRWQSEVASTAKNIDIPVGITDGGEVVNLLFDDSTPHALLLGGTGSGKTNFLHTVVQAGCLKFSPRELRLFLADLKSGVSFEPYARRDGLGSHFGAVACTSSVVFGAVLIDAARQEMQRRYEAFKRLQRRLGVSIDGLSQYRDLASPADEQLPRLLVIVDEFQVLFDDAKRRYQTGEHLVSLLRLGRQVGVHVMLATQSLQGKASHLEQVLSQIHVRMILPAAKSDANSIFRSSSLAEQAVAYCSTPGKCFMSRDFGERGGIGFINPYRKDNGFFFASLPSLAAALPSAEPLIPIVWSDAVGSLSENVEFDSRRDRAAAWYLGVPYSADHALSVTLENGVTAATVAVEERVHARALLGSLLMSLRRLYESVDVVWVDQQKAAGPLRRVDLDTMLRGLGLTDARSIESLGALTTAPSDGESEQRPQVVIVPDASLLRGKAGGERAAAWAGPLTGEAGPASPPDIDHLRSITRTKALLPRVVLLLARSFHDFVDGDSKAVSELASIRIASGRLQGSRMREFMKVGDLPEMADDDLVVTTEEVRRPKTFRPFEEQWN